MKIKCSRCGRSFEGNISRKNGRWYSACPDCNQVIQVPVSKGRIVMAFVDDSDPSLDGQLFTDDFTGQEIRSYYAFDDPKEFIDTWLQLVDTGNDSMWYWCLDRGRLFCSGACDPDDLYRFYEHFKMRVKQEIVMKIYTEREWANAQYTNRWGDNPWNKSRVEAGEVPADYIGRRTIMVGGKNGCELLTEGYHFLINDEEGRVNKYHVTYRRDPDAKLIYHGMIVEAPDANVAEQYFRHTHPDAIVVKTQEVRSDHMKPGVPFAKVKEGRWKGAGMGDHVCSLCGYTAGDTPAFCPECHAYML